MGIYHHSNRYMTYCHASVTDHAVKMHELPDEYLADAMPIAKRIATAQGLENYNILQVSTSTSTPSLLYMNWVRGLSHRTTVALPTKKSTMFTSTSYPSLAFLIKKDSSSVGRCRNPAQMSYRNCTKKLLPNCENVLELNSFTVYV